MIEETDTPRESGPVARPEAADAPPAEPATDEIVRLRGELGKKEDELKAVQDKYLRAIAEMENHKRRAARDQIEQIRYSNEKLLREMLPVLDNLERALAHGAAGKEAGGWTQGVELTYRQCLDVLKKFGVSPITSVGEPFDPGRHQAVTQIETDAQPENHVAEELQKGYFFHDRILRPAMVAVARKPSPPPETASGGDGGAAE